MSQQYIFLKVSSEPSVGMQIEIKVEVHGMSGSVNLQAILRLNFVKYKLAY